MKEGQKIAEAAEKFLINKMWARLTCPQCNKDYYTKNKQPLLSCGSYKCMGGYLFLNDAKPKRLKSERFLIEIIKKYLSTHNTKQVSPIRIVRNKERTLFASAAGQVFDDFIYEKKIGDNSNCFVIQPVLRTQSIKSIAAIDGFSSSFVNIASVEWLSSHEKYLQLLDNLLLIISALGLYVGSLTLKIAKDTNDWQGKEVKAYSLKINYKGLEIGIANLFYDIQVKSGNVILSDVGIGLERLLWAVNKHPAYFDSFSPLHYSVHVPRENLDAIRTAVLMVGSGVAPGHREHGQKLRSILEPLHLIGYNLDWFELVNYFHQWWSKYLLLERSNLECYRIIKAELDRYRNLKLIHAKIGIQESPNQLTSQLIEKALFGKKDKQFTSIEKLRRILLD